MFLINARKFKTKPSSWEVAIIQKEWQTAFRTKNLSILREAIQNGQTFCLTNQPEQVVIIDYDQAELDLHQALEKLRSFDLRPTLAFETFSAGSIREDGKTKKNFKLLYVFDREITNNEKWNFYFLIENTLEVELDRSSIRNNKQICYGTNKLVYFLKQGTIELNNQKIDFSKNTSKIVSKSSKQPLMSKTIEELEAMEYKEFKDTLKHIFESKQHLSYDLALRLAFASVNNSKYLEQVFALASDDTITKIKQLLRTKNKEYGFKLFQPNGNFSELLKRNLKNAKKRLSR